MCHSQPGWLLSGCDQVLLPTRKAGGLSLGSEARVQDVWDCKALDVRVRAGLPFPIELHCVLPPWGPHFPWFLCGISVAWQSGW